MYRFANSLTKLEDNPNLLTEMLMHVEDKDKERF